LGFVKKFSNLRALILSKKQVVFTIIFGVVSLVAMLIWPTYLFPLTWLSFFLIFDPLNHLAGRPSIISQVSRGDYRVVIAFALGALVCGFFWEMWNRDASVAWEYSIGYLDFARIFEMPLLGYAGNRSVAVPHLPEETAHQCTQGKGNDNPVVASAYLRDDAGPASQVIKRVKDEEKTQPG
jgi:hypothetical protein